MIRFKKNIIFLILLAGLSFSSESFSALTMAPDGLGNGPGDGLGNGPKPTPAPAPAPAQKPLTPAQQAAKDCAGKSKTTKVCCYDLTVGATASTLCRKDVANSSLSAYECCKRHVEKAMAADALNKFNEKKTKLTGPIGQSQLPEGTVIGAVEDGEPPCNNGGGW